MSDREEIIKKMHHNLYTIYNINDTKKSIQAMKDVGSFIDIQESQIKQLENKNNALKERYNTQLELYKDQSYIVDEFRCKINQLEAEKEALNKNTFLLNKLLELIINNGDCPHCLDLHDNKTCDGQCIEFNDVGCKSCWIKAISNQRK